MTALSGSQVFQLVDTYGLPLASLLRSARRMRIRLDLEKLAYIAAQEGWQPWAALEEIQDAIKEADDLRPYEAWKAGELTWGLQERDDPVRVPGL